MIKPSLFVSISNESQCLHFTYVNILAHSDTILKHTKNSCETEGQTTLQKQASSKTSNNLLLVLPLATIQVVCPSNSQRLFLTCL